MSILSVDLPDSLSQKIEQIALEEGISVNQFIASAAAEKMAVFVDAGFLKREAAKGSREKFERVMRKIPNVPPDPGDEMPEM